MAKRDRLLTILKTREHILAVRSTVCARESLARQMQGFSRVICIHSLPCTILSIPDFKLNIYIVAIVKCKLKVIIHLYTLYHYTVTLSLP